MAADLLPGSRSVCGCDRADFVTIYYRGLRKAHPAANYRDMSKYGHAMYCILDPKSYVKDIENIIQHNRSDFLG